MSIRLFPIAASAALLPLVAIHVSYLWAASSGHVDWCFPYTGNCSSISATGRQPPESFFFKGVMIPAAVLVGAYSWLCTHWLVALGCDARVRRRILLVLGVVASVGLIVYTVALGSIGPEYRLQRRIGVIAFFGGVLLVQLLVTHLLERMASVRTQHRSALRRLEVAAAVILLTGLTSVALSAADEALHRRLEDTFEWTFVALLCIHVMLCALFWRATGFSADMTCNTGNRHDT